MEYLFSCAKRVVWLDHHKTAFEMWCGEDYLSIAQAYEAGEPRTTESYVLLDNRQSGAHIAWRYFHPNTEVPMLIQHIDDYDRWQFKLDGTKEFNKALTKSRYGFKTLAVFKIKLKEAIQPLQS